MNRHYIIIVTCIDGAIRWAAISRRVMQSIPLILCCISNIDLLNKVKQWTWLPVKYDIVVFMSRMYILCRSVDDARGTILPCPPPHCLFTCIKRLLHAFTEQFRYQRSSWWHFIVPTDINKVVVPMGRTKTGRRFKFSNVTVQFVEQYSKSKRPLQKE